MNKGSIPGYYYDEEKQKYFKIQANHLVPQNSKYSRGSVKQEKRKAKKQKVEETKQGIRRQCTITRNALLKNPVIGGTGLAREHGGGTRLEYLIAGDRALISQYRPSYTMMKISDVGTNRGIQIKTAKYLPETSQLITGIGQENNEFTSLHVNYYDWKKPEFDTKPGSGLAGFISPIKSISATMHGGLLRLLVCCQQRSAAGQIFTTLVPTTDPDPDPDHFQQGGIFLNIGDKYELVNSSSLHQTTGLAAVLGTSKIVVLDANLDVTAKYRFLAGREYDNYSIDWLNPNTVAWSCNDANKDRSRVTLWDIRTEKGTSERFTLHGRITGVRNPWSSSGSDGGQQLLVSTNHRINLFDTRMVHSDSKHDTPVLSFSHVHQGPVLEYDTNETGQLIAAVDRDDIVQVYSVRSGCRVGALAVSHGYVNGRKQVLPMTETKLEPSLSLPFFPNTCLN